MKLLIVLITIFHTTLSVAQGIFSEVPIQNLLERNGFEKKLSIPYIHNVRRHGPKEHFYKLTSKWAVIEFNDYDDNKIPYRNSLTARIVNLDTGRDVLKLSFKDYDFQDKHINLRLPFWDQEKRLIYYDFGERKEEYLEINPETATVLVKKKSTNPRLKFFFRSGGKIDSRSGVEFFLENEKGVGFRLTNLDTNKSIFIKDGGRFKDGDDVSFKDIAGKLITPGFIDNNVPLVVQRNIWNECGSRSFLINPLTLEVIHSMEEIEGCGTANARRGSRRYLPLDLKNVLIYSDSDSTPKTTFINLISGKVKWQIDRFYPIKRVSERYLLGFRTDGSGGFHINPIAYVLADIESGEVKSLPLNINRNLLASGFLFGIDSTEESGKSILGTFSFLNFDSTDVGFSIGSIGSIKFNSTPDVTWRAFDDFSRGEHSLELKAPFMAYGIHASRTMGDAPSYSEFWVDTTNLLFARAEHAEFVTPQLVVVKSANILEVYKK